MADDGPSQPEKPELTIGSYRLLQSLGAGGMSSVFRAVHDQTGLEVALKVLPRAFAKNPTTVQRFLREAKSGEALQHPGIVAIYDRGIDQGRHYLVLEYVAGGDLHDRIRANGPMSASEAVAIIRSVAVSLKFAESQGLIHRDIKPANILLTADGQAKVADLGLALRSMSEDERVTREGTTVGTVDYMAPEQARDSRGTSIRSDIYSLGCTFYFLLTGQPPYPGGDIADKLARHCTAPVPSPRDFRNDLSEPIAAVVVRMMAKRPEHRYENYDALIAALDQTPAIETSHSLSSTLIQTPSPLFALLDDESDDDIRNHLQRDKALMSPRPIVDLDSSVIPFGDISLAAMSDLADIEEASPRPRPPMVPNPVRGAELPRTRLAEDHHDETVPEEPESLEADSTALGTAAPFDRNMTDGERSWLMTCVLVGLALVLIIIGGDKLLRGGRGNEELILNAIEGLSDRHDSETIAFENAVVVRPADIVKPKPAAAAEPTPAAPKVVAWTEPADPVIEPDDDLDFGEAIESRFVPAWVRNPAPAAPAGKVVNVHRLADPRDLESKSSLRAALDVVGGLTIEIADDGPFFENDLKFVGDSRLIRAAKGFRPIINLEVPRSEVALNQAAYLDLGEKDLVFEGIDLVIDLATLSRSQVALFFSRGGGLTLRNCSITLLNRTNQTFSVYRSGPSGRPSRFLMEQSIVRGAFFSVLDVGAGPIDAAISRSLVFNRLGGVISEWGQGAGPSDRNVWLIRSVLASTNSAVIRSVTPPLTRRKLLNIRALATTFAHFQTLAPTSLITALSEVGPSEMVDWSGEFNEYQGWAGWFSAGVTPRVGVAGLREAQTVWRGTDSTSLESPLPWPTPPAAERVLGEQLRDFARSRLATLDRLSSPSRSLLEQTLEAFIRPNEPKLKPLGSTPVAQAAAPVIQSIAVENRALEQMPGFAPPGAASPSPTGKPIGRELVFETDQPGQNGDLGLYLAANIQPADKFVRVKVRGFGDHPFTPFRAPDDVSLEIIVEARPGEISPSWSTSTGTSSSAAIEIRGGSLRLSGLRLSRSGSPLLRSLIRVEHGHLVLERCRLTETGKVQETPGPLIDFGASGSKPLAATEAVAGLFDPFVDRPVCRISETILKGGGHVLAAEIGRGLLIFRQSVLISTESLLSLNLSKIAKSRVEADLVLDHCTLVAEQGFVELGPWLGAAPGPDRPCLISSSNCVYFGTFDKGVRDSTLLRADPQGFASGALFWQSSGDDYEVANFTSTLAPKAATTAVKRIDVRWQWIDLWGQNHAKGVTGPRNGAAGGVRLFAKLRPGDVEPGDLFIDPDAGAGKNATDLGADLAKLGLAPSPIVGRRRP